MVGSSNTLRGFWLALALTSMCLMGCGPDVRLISPAARRTIDRSVVEYPAGYRLQTILRDLTGPTAITFDKDGSLIVADRGVSDHPTIYGFKPDGTRFQIWPDPKRSPFGLGSAQRQIRGPIGGMVAAYGSIYVYHRDAKGRGMISSLDYNGHATTVVADLPCEGENGVMDLVVNPYDGRLYFAVGSMTNSGVVGLDNWDQGWVGEHGWVCDQPAGRYRLLGYRFDTPNPRAGWFMGSDIAVTAPYQPFGHSSQMWVDPPANGKPTAAVYSAALTGGDLRLEAYGIRCARGLAFNDFGRLYATDQGMELRGTRPVRDDPDTLLRIVKNTWYGWPDYSADLQPITERRFQPPLEMIIKTGYPELSFVLDHQASGLMRPDRATLLQSTFASMAGASKLAFVPSWGPMKEFNGSAVIALFGDRAPFATSGRSIDAVAGYKVVLADVDNHQWHDFVFNTRMGPGSRHGSHPDALERPFDVKFGPDGAMYILDMGRVQMADGKLDPAARTGKILKLDVGK